MQLFFLFLGVVLVNNFVLSQFLGMCSFIGVSGKTETALGMGLAVTFVIVLTALFSYMMLHYVLVPLNVEYLSTLAFILIIAVLVQFVEMFVKKSSPTLYRSLGVYLPLIITNCAVLGVAIINKERNYNLVESVVYAFGASCGYVMAILLLAGIRERLEKANVPKIFKGFPITFIIAGLMSLAFLGFSGLQ